MSEKKLVPAHPTEDMCAAGARSLIDSQDRMGTSWADEAHLAYRAMLEAAPPTEVTVTDEMPAPEALAAQRLAAARAVERAVVERLAAQGEPVAWRWRDDAWNDWSYATRRSWIDASVSPEPLYAAPQPAPTVTDAMRMALREMTRAAPLLEYMPDDYGEAINALRAAIGGAK